MPFKPGQSGNPKGRPARTTFRDVVRSKLREPHPNEPEKARIEVWAVRMLEEAETKDNEAKLDILKWLDGASPPDKGRGDDEPDEVEAVDDGGNVVEP